MGEVQIAGLVEVGEDGAEQCRHRLNIQVQGAVGSGDGRCRRHEGPAERDGKGKGKRRAPNGAAQRVDVWAGAVSAGWPLIVVEGALVGFMLELGADGPPPGAGVWLPLLSAKFRFPSFSPSPWPT